MAGITQLNTLLESMSPELKTGEYVFCTVRGNASDYEHFSPLASFAESEGLTLVLSAEKAKQAKLAYKSTFRQITLTVHSSLEAVGLTAAVSTKLADYGISANVIAAYYHDHIFVPAEKAQKALAALKELQKPERLKKMPPGHPETNTHHQRQLSSKNLPGDTRARL